ncbi:AAA family ATPase [Pseudomonas proteolytica]|uniref:AAA family ATPase n=2 Tax=Pseudomonas proteolytica TaxID=219574 RepID=A0AAW5AGY8_9PSED|nr:AAA family ATPase [Pseudomonas proteolytica]MCF5102436.1 AAA family ATPase [Pseudomonas proteolytica]
MCIGQFNYKNTKGMKGINRMASIKLLSLRFEDPAFRKLANIKIDFADRITLIAGHNGIGKSTILGLVSNGSGFTDSTYKSYFNKTFQGNLNEIIHLDYENELVNVQSSGLELPTPFIDYTVNGAPLTKSSTLTRRTSEQRVRVVVRNHPSGDFITKDNSISVGPDAKVPLPTIYLGMSRMIPVGESNPAWIKNTADKKILPEDAVFIRDFINSVIELEEDARNSEDITTSAIQGTKKTAKHPKYSYSSSCVSLGQDSLSAIATALSSFNKLKREMDESYPGGLLVIDELDAGFHPHAQTSLMSAISTAARQLKLQVIATTHSLCLIESIHPENFPKRRGKPLDSIVYITDSSSPRTAVNYTLSDIRRDMSLTIEAAPKKAKTKELKIYMEDEEAHFFLKRIITPALRARVKKEASVLLKMVPLSMGCDNLNSLPKHDDHFKTVLIALDADSSIKGKPEDTRNIIKMPGALDAQKKGLSPERTLYKFLKHLAYEKSGFPLARAKLIEKKVTSDFLKKYLVGGNVDMDDRDTAKNWMNKRLKYLTNWDVVGMWISEHSTEVKKFEDQLVSAATLTAKVTI